MKPFIRSCRHWSHRAALFTAFLILCGGSQPALAEPILTEDGRCLQLYESCDGSCEVLGYNKVLLNAENDCIWCYDGDGDNQCDGTPPPAAVPELEEYAAALFLGLALLIGWKARRNLRTSTV
ncbi:hypothetical protein SH668x_002367 [Planctomicrobium sp. SH668]|uniref:hypothetical protein n=1 Tax=Planctomicrobium sp. SH668 TaxID=3448126 RepID=UPI003F5B566E